MKKRSFFIGYRKRILLSIAFLVVLITLSLTIYGTITTRQIFKTHVEQTGNYLSKNLAANSQLGVFAEDELFLAPPLAAILQNEDVFWACVYNQVGREIACITSRDTPVPDVPETVKLSMQNVFAEDILQNRIPGREGFDVLDFYSPIYISAQPEFDTFYGDVETIYGEKRFVGFARVGMSLDDLAQSTEQLLVTSAMLFLITLLMGLLAIFYIEKKITAPVRDIAKGAAKIAEGDLDTRIPVNSEDELGELAAEFNNMTAKLKQYESEIVKRGDFLENLIECANSIIVETDNNYNITRFNRFAEETFKYKKNEAMWKNAIRFLICREHQDQAAKVFRQPHIHTGYQCRCLTRDSKQITVSWVNSLIVDEKGTTAGILLIGTDVTEKIRIEQQLFHSEKLKSLGEMAGGVAHDFNNLLAAIVGRVQLIKKQINKTTLESWNDLQQKLLNNLDIIEQASKDGAETVKRIQTFAKIRKDETGFEKIDIQDQIDSALEFTKTRWKNIMTSEGKKVSINRDFLQTPAIAGNPSEIREVFTNLINNALDAMPEGGELFFRTRADESDVTVEVEDSGTGIPDDIRGRVFDPFYSTKGAMSSGLGLSICHGIITRHKGSISIENKQGKGTKFVINLPVYSGNVLNSETELLSCDTPCSGNRILVIEDDQNVRELLADMLREDDHIVETAACGHLGIRKFSESGFDFVFTDLGMDDISGWEVIKAVKNINPKIPVALVTGWGAQIDEEQKIKNLADEVVNKPFSVEKIRQVVYRFNSIIKDNKPAC